MVTSKQSGYRANESFASVLDFGEDKNSAILFKPRVEATIHGETVTGVAKVCLDLLPRPSVHIYCELETPRAPLLALRMQADPESVPILKVAGKELKGFGIEAMFSSDDNGKLLLRWCPESLPVNWQGDQNTRMERVEAHVFNLLVPGLPTRIQKDNENAEIIDQIELRSAIWNVTLRSMERANEIRKYLHTKGGHVVSHVVNVSRTDNGSFSGEVAGVLLEGLRLFLCLVVGRECRAVCPVGYNALGDRVWSQWSSPNLWEDNVLSWFHGRDSTPLAALFPGFMQRWEAERWREALKEAISWYVSGNQASRGIEGGMIFAQSAIERLAYEYCVCEKVYVRTQGFKGLPAADQYRMLLSSLSIPLGIPAEATALLAAAKSNNWEDGPKALTQLRNDLVHGGIKRANWSNDCYVEAWKLSLWYVEMVLLALCGYSDLHWNRNNRQVEAVPW